VGFLHFGAQRIEVIWRLKNSKQLLSSAIGKQILLVKRLFLEHLIIVRKVLRKKPKYHELRFAEHLLKLVRAVQSNLPSRFFKAFDEFKTDPKFPVRTHKTGASTLNLFCPAASAIRG